MKTVTVTVVVSVGGVQQMFSASGETDGSVHGLAEGLVGATHGNARRWLRDQEYEVRRMAREVARLGLPLE